MNTIPVERTKKGHPALWERGGGWSNTGSAQIVAGPKGEALKPVYIRRRGELACSEHALFIIRAGYHIVQAQHHRGDFTIRVYRITGNPDGDTVPVSLVCEFDQGEWDKEPPAELASAIKAAKEKATCYHCRCAHYAKTD